MSHARLTLLGPPLVALVGLCLTAAVVPDAPIFPGAPVRTFLDAGFAGASTWFALRLVDVAEQAASGRVVRGGETSQHARSALTRIRLGRNLAAVAVAVVGIVAAIAAFDGVETAGASLLASAGLATVVVGFAAQRVLGAVLAGATLALTEPVRLDDLVEIDGHAGWVEQLTITHAVVRLWDQRRLVVPITYFLEQPFENWTRSGDGPTCAFDLEVDPRVPIRSLRAALAEAVGGASQWDRTTCALSVHALDRARATIRVHIGANALGELSELRNVVREALLAFLQREHPEGFLRPDVR